MEIYFVPLSSTSHETSLIECKVEKVKDSILGECLLATPVWYWEEEDYLRGTFTESQFQELVDAGLIFKKANPYMRVRHGVEVQPIDGTKAVICHPWEEVTE